MGAVTLVGGVGSTVGAVASLLCHALDERIHHLIMATQTVGVSGLRGGLTEGLAGLQNADAIDDLAVGPEQSCVGRVLGHHLFDLTAKIPILFKDCCHVDVPPLRTVLKFLQACSQVRAALLLIVIFNGVSDGAPTADNGGGQLCTGDGSIDQRPLKHPAALNADKHGHVLSAL